MPDDIMVIQIASGGGDGCCGGVVNDDFLGMPGADELTCANGTHTDRIYRQLRDTYGDRLDINMVDPKNTIAIVRYLIGSWRKKQISAAQVGRNVALGIRPGAWFYNGRWLNPDGSTTEEAILDRIHRRRREIHPSLG